MLIDEAGLQPTHRILDVGCGPGRLALAFKNHLQKPGRYEGFDVRERAIEWARRHVGGTRDDIGFHHIDLFNRAYNRSGTVQPSEFRFPYEDGSFDMVTLFSVFTHMVTDDVTHYLAEIARVLAPGGTAVATFFLLDGPQTIDAGTRTLAFVHRFPGYLAIDPNVPEKAVAYPEATVRDLYRDAGLDIVEPLRYGSWRGLPGAPMIQDLIVARRP